MTQTAPPATPGAPPRLVRVLTRPEFAALACVVFLGAFLWLAVASAAWPAPWRFWLYFLAWGLLLLVLGAVGASWAVAAHRRGGD